MFGWTGKVLRINLTTGQINIEHPALDRYQQYIGGRGLGCAMLWEEVPAQVEPLSPENKLIFLTGPFTGTKVPTSGRFTVTAKSPLTGTVFDSNSGGIWGARLKKAGYDGLIVEGKSDKPVYLKITENGAWIKDAAGVWGLNVPETTNKIKEIEGQGYSVACIGPAGENLVKVACIMNDKTRALGRGGLGAVMGAKMLKGIAVTGQQKVAVADPEKLEFLLYETDKWLKANPITSQGLPEFGTPVLVNLFNDSGIFPAYNFRDSQFAEAEKISGETLAEKHTVAKKGCYGCPIKCTRVTRTSREEGEGPEYESLWALGPQCGISDLEAIAEAGYLCNRLGLDTISVGSSIGCAMEMAENKLIDIELKFGDAGKLASLIEDIAYRRGFGNDLAEGTRLLASKYNGPQYAMQVKGLELPAYDPRGLQGMGLGFATSNRGGCHLRAYMVGPEVLGVPKMVDRFGVHGKAGLTIFYQNINAAMDSLIICRFVGLAVSEEYFARLLTAVTGVDYQPQDLHFTGERIWNLERLYNLREGLTQLDDTLPERLLNEAIKSGPSKGHVVNLDSMLADYYRYRGWDANGVPNPEKISQLGLEVN
ncbi:MAG: aldehyde ferredoxin oxidoreductase family protein [Thermincola sp.]|jgi:aldehyde:ferredoxin oxidoreductase|nr:aldehyde ferredoxin oxidoreductase family protein [Thermincola sp.]MDT3701506.1 aldehyde ferredoxin oxidoreductase family protein [Thermincola sp.]